MKSYLHRGDNVTVAAAPYAVASGAGCLVGKMFGVAESAALAGAAVVLALIGVFMLAKKAGDTPAAGALVYWDDANKVVTTTAAGNTVIGVCLAAPAAGDAQIRVRLNGAFVS